MPYGEARQVLAEVLRRLPLLPLPWRMQAQIDLADTWLLLGSIERTAAAARKVASVTAARGLRCWALRAWMSLAETSEDPAEAESARAAAAMLARQLRDDLDADLGASFEARPGIAGLLWAMD